jgi:hypothetical protein
LDANDDERALPVFGALLGATVLHHRHLLARIHGGVPREKIALAWPEYDPSECNNAQAIALLILTLPLI